MMGELNCIKLFDGTTVVATGDIDEVTDDSWSVLFVGVPDGTYTLKIGHCSDCSDAAVANIRVDADATSRRLSS